MKLFKNLFEKKVVDLDRDGKIESIREEIEGITAGFQRMFDNLSKKTNELHDIVEEAVEVINKANSEIDKAKEQIEKNERIKKKLEDFI